MLNGSTEPSIYKLSSRAPRFFCPDTGMFSYYPIVWIRTVYAVSILLASSRMLIAAFRSLSISFPHVQRLTLSDNFSSFFIFPHLLHFGKSIQDNGYGMFRNMLDYKLAWKGKKLVKIDRFFPSSKKCSKCGKITKELGLSERVYRCTCGNEMDRDRNAAINIREEARRMLAV